MIKSELEEALEDLARDVKPQHAAPAIRMRILKPASTSRVNRTINPKGQRDDNPKGKPEGRLARWKTARKRKHTPVNMFIDPLVEQKTLLFSERHPIAFKTTRLILPRLPALAVALPLVYFMLANLLKRDYFFFIRWYHESWILPNLVSIVSSKAAFMHWWKFYGPITIMAGMLIFFSLVVFYLFVWRFIFKDYTRQSEGVETSEGRAYWIEGRNMWFNLWDLFYGIHYQRKHKVPYRPDRRVLTVYLNTSFFPPPNPSAPGRKMLKIKLSRDRDEWIENRGAYELIGHEGLYRRITGIREMETHNVGYKSDPLAMKEARRIFKDRMEGLVKDTQKLTKANVNVRLDQMKSGTVQMDDELRQMIIEERRKKAEEDHAQRQTKAGS